MNAASDVAAAAPPAAAAEFARAMRAFPTLLRIGVAEVVAYRAEFLVWILTTNMPLVMLALWHAVAADGAGRALRSDASSPPTTWACWWCGSLTSNWVVWQMSMEIRDGTLSAKLLRPIHPLYAYAADHLAAMPMRVLVVSPIVAVLVVTPWDRLARHDPALVLVLRGVAGRRLAADLLLDGAARRARVLRRERDGRVRALARRARDLLGLPDPARGAARLGRASAARVLPFRFMLGVPRRDAGRPAVARARRCASSARSGCTWS